MPQSATWAAAAAGLGCARRLLRLYQLAAVIGVAVLADGIVLLALHGPELRQLWAVEMVVLVPIWVRGMRNAGRCMRLTRWHTTA